jgi:hypothetical protein
LHWCIACMNRCTRNLGNMNWCIFHMHQSMACSIFFWMYRCIDSHVHWCICQLDEIFALLSLHFIFSKNPKNRDFVN